jgi:hypothetical protein
MPKNVVAMFARTLEAEDAIIALQKAGFDRNQISIVANDVSGVVSGAPGGATTSATAGAGAGAVIGGIAGLVAGLGALAVPGIGPLIAAGPLAVAIGSAGVGATAGGLLGALTGMNIPESDANYYAEGVRKGSALVVVRTDDAHAEKAREILDGEGAAKITDNVGNGDRNGYGRPQEETGPSEYDIERDMLNRSSRPDTPQLTRSAARVYMSGLELDPRKSRFEDFERDYRTDFAQRSVAGYTYEQFSPAYRYGYDLARVGQFRGMDWSDVESEARRGWEDRNPDTWERVRDAVKFGFENSRS